MMKQGIRTGIDTAEKRLDIVHIVIGTVIVVMAVLAFLDPVKNMVLFPFIFFFAGLIYLITAIFLFRISDHDRSVILRGAAQLGAALALFVVTFIAAVGIWT